MTNIDLGGATPSLRSIYNDIHAAFLAAREYLFSKISGSSYEKKGTRLGDGSTIHDPIVFDRFFLDVAKKHNMLLICEEQTRRGRHLNSKGCQHLLILDPIDGTKNMMAGLPFGVNAAFGTLPANRDFTIGDIEGVFVGDYLTEKRFAWVKGCSPTILRPEYVPSHQWENFAGERLLYEIPDERSYLPPDYPDGETYQKNLLAMFRTLFPEAQRRAVDCTGLRILEVADSNLIAYGDVRRATRIWDTVPSVKFLIEYSPSFVALAGDLSEINNQMALLRWEADSAFRLIENVGDEIIVLPRDVLLELRRPVKSVTVFIVHGRDVAAADEVARFLEHELSCSCILLKEKVNRGQTIIQKLKQYSDTQAAVVILSPDDEGRLANTSDTTRLRARQNVIFELGLFYGKLGQENVIAMNKGVEKPSDIDGVLHIDFDAHGGWKNDLQREINAIIAQRSTAPYALTARR